MNSRVNAYWFNVWSLQFGANAEERSSTQREGVESVHSLKMLYQAQSVHMQTVLLSQEYTAESGHRYMDIRPTWVFSQAAGID